MHDPNGNASSASPTGRIRRVGRDDAEAITEVVVSSGLFDAVDAQLVGSSFAEHLREGGDARQRWVVFEKDGTIAGTAFYRAVEGADSVWDLTMIAVRSDWQGTGVGSRLMAHVEAELSAEDQRRLLVQTSGQPGFRETRRFYRHRGYTRHGHVPDYWADGDDMILLGKQLRHHAPVRRASSAAVEVRAAATVDLDSLRPLWLQLHHHHQEVVEGFDGFVTDDEQSWSRRRATYQELLAGSHGFLLIAHGSDAPLGYAAVELREGADDTFAVGARHAEVLTLVVDEDVRNAGIGSVLLDRVDERLAAVGAEGLVISVMSTNHAAVRFYQRRGLIPVETYLWRVP